jgi:hypothetical protein
LDSKKEE